MRPIVLVIKNTDHNAWAAGSNSGGSDATSSAVYDSFQLLRLAFDRPGLLSFDDDPVVSLCAGTTIAERGSLAHVNGIAVTQSGVPILILGRRMETHEEFDRAAETLRDGAKLLRLGGYERLNEKVGRHRRIFGANPVYQIARRRWPNLDQAAFTKTISRRLRKLRNYLLVIVTDRAPPQVYYKKWTVIHVVLVEQVPD